MRKLHRQSTSLRVLLAGILITIAGIAWAQTSGMQLGVYVVVDDLAASKQFYETLVGQEPIIENADFVAYSLAGGVLGIYRSQAFTHELRRGNNAVIYIRVQDIEQEFNRVQDMPGATLIHEEIVREPYISLFMFTDPDGNAVEFYAL